MELRGEPLCAYLYLRGCVALVYSPIGLMGIALVIRSRGGNQGFASEVWGVTVGMEERYL
jgi:hypothetical protein